MEVNKKRWCIHCAQVKKDPDFQNGLGFVFVVIWIRRFWFASLTDVNKKQFKLIRWF